MGNFGPQAQISNNMKKTNRKRRRGCWISAIVIAVMTIVLTVCWWAYRSNGRQRKISLLGASPRGRYTYAARALADYLRTRLGHNYQFIPSASEGSVQNIRDLQHGRAQISLIQEDVAYYFDKGGHSILKVGHRRNNKVKGICFLFWENLYIFAAPGKKSVQQLNRVHIGSLYNGSGVTAINLREQLQQRWNFVSGGNAVDALKQGKVDAIIALTADPQFIIKELQQKQTPFHLIGLSDNEIASITASLTFYHEREITLNGVQHKTIATRALLAVNQKLPMVIAQALLNLFTQPQGQEYAKVVQRCPEIGQFLEGKTIWTLSEANPRFIDYPLPMHPLVFELRWGSRQYLPFFIASLPVLCLLLFLVYLRQGRRYRKLLADKALLGITANSLFEALWPYLFLINLLFLYLLAMMYLIKYLEIQAFIYNGTSEPSPFVTMDFQQLCTWIIVFTVASYEDEIFPTTELAKIAASSIRLITIGCMMFIIGRISADYVKTLIKGTSMKKGYNLKDHVVICNWTPKAERIIEELHSSLLRETMMVRPVVVICEGEIKFPDTPEFEDTFCIPGDPLSSWKLRNANVHDAFAVIILNDKDRGADADNHTIMVAMEIVEIVEEQIQLGTIKHGPHIAAEIMDGKKQKYLQRAGVHEIISGNDIGIKLLAQTAVTPGITTFMKDLLQYSAESNEIYVVEPPAELLAAQAGFTTISSYFIQHREQLHQAILVGIYRDNPPQMLVNPDKSQFPGLTSEDKLVIMARQRPIWIE